MSTGPTEQDLNNANNLVGLMQQMNDLSDGLRNNFSDTFSATSQLVTAVSELGDRLNTVNNSISDSASSALNLTENLSSAADQVERQSRALDGMSEILSQANKSQESWLGKQAKIFASQRDLFSSIGAVGKSVFGSIGSFMNTLLQNPFFKAIGYVLNTFIKIVEMGKKAIQIAGFMATGALQAVKKITELMIGIPLKISESVSEMGGILRKETEEVFDQMVENIKEKLNITSGLGRAFKDSVEEGKANLGEFYDLNNRMVRQFGMGSEGFAKLMSQSQDLIMQLGVNLNFFGKALGKNRDTRANFVMLAKSLNLTANDVENLGIVARSTGQGIITLGIDIFNSIDRSAKKFGLDGKTISNTVFNLRGDFIEFGHMTTEAIADTVAELTQMGVQAEDIVAVFKKFDTFESAAQSAAMLSQTFGMNVDALRLIQAESPTEIFNELTTAMYNTGRSFADLNRHERALMAQHTGLSGKTLEMVMNYTEAGYSYEEAMKKAEEQDPVNKQTAALDKMTAAITKLNKVLSFKSPFAAFADGLKKTLLQNTGLRESMEALNKSYQDFYTVGLKIDPEILKQATKPFEKIVNKIKGILGSPELKNFMTNLVGNLSKFLGRVMEGKFTNEAGDITRKAFRNIFSFDNISKGGGLLTGLMEVGGGIIGNIVKGMFVVVEEISKVLIKGIDKLTKMDTSEIAGPEWFAKILNRFFGLSADDEKNIIAPALRSLGNLLAKIPDALGPIIIPVKNFFESIATFFVNKIVDSLVPALNRAAAEIPVLNWFTSDESLMETVKKKGFSSKEKEIIDLTLKGKTFKDEYDASLPGGGMITEGTDALKEFDLSDQQQNMIAAKLLYKIDQLQKSNPQNRNLEKIINEIKTKESNSGGRYDAWESDSNFAKLLKLYSQSEKSIQAQDMFIQTDTNDELFAAKPGGLFDSIFGVFGNSTSPLSPIVDFINTSFGSNQEETANNTKDLVREIKALRQEINNRPVVVQGNINMDGQKVADLTMKNLSSVKNVGNRVNETAFTNGALGETTQFT